MEMCGLWVKKKKLLKEKKENCFFCLFFYVQKKHGRVMLGRRYVHQASTSSNSLLMRKNKWNLVQCACVCVNKWGKREMFWWRNLKKQNKKESWCFCFTLTWIGGTIWVKGDWVLAVVRFRTVLQNNSTYGHNPFSGGEGVTESMPLTVWLSCKRDR